MLPAPESSSRPLAAQALGPDGALYMADFCNCIIGHYEVPLDHPLRDRERGRVWRVYYAGQEGEGTRRPRKVDDLTALGLEALWAELADPDLVVRTLATHEIADRFGGAAAPPLRRWIAGACDPAQRAHGLWVLARLGALDEKLIARLGDPADGRGPAGERRGFGPVAGDGPGRPFDVA